MIATSLEHRNCKKDKRHKRIEGKIVIAEILILIARIILIIAGGMSATSATAKVANESGIEFDTLWDLLPKKWE